MIRAMIAILADYEDLAEQGKLITLPCAVGSHVYTISHGGVVKCEVMGYDIFKDGYLAYLSHTVRFGEWEIGKTVFLTESEAKVALEKKREDD